VPLVNSKRQRPKTKAPAVSSDAAQRRVGEPAMVVMDSPQQDDALGRSHVCYPYGQRTYRRLCSTIRSALPRAARSIRHRPSAPFDPPPGLPARHRCGAPRPARAVPPFCPAVFPCNSRSCPGVISRPNAGPRHGPEQSCLLIAFGALVFAAHRLCLGRSRRNSGGDLRRPPLGADVPSWPPPPPTAISVAAAAADVARAPQSVQEPRACVYPPPPVIRSRDLRRSMPGVGRPVAFQQQSLPPAAAPLRTRRAARPTILSLAPRHAAVSAPPL